MDRFHCSRRMQVALAILATIVVMVVGVAIKLGNDLAVYLETSVARTAEDIPINGPASVVAPTPRPAPKPALVASAQPTEIDTAGDTADPPKEVGVASVH